MRFYTHQHKFYCGIDLHARSMYVCIINQDGEILVHRNLPAWAVWKNGGDFVAMI